jgi:C4-dicarboxylate-specific signal transduction histidine kinase
VVLGEFEIAQRTGIQCWNRSISAAGQHIATIQPCGSPALGYQVLTGPSKADPRSEFPMKRSILLGCWIVLPWMLACSSERSNELSKYFSKRSLARQEQETRLANRLTKLREQDDKIRLEIAQKYLHSGGIIFDKTEAETIRQAEEQRKRQMKDLQIQIIKVGIEDVEDEVRTFGETPVLSKRLREYRERLEGLQR